MIEKASGYRVGEQFFPTIIEAQDHEIENLLVSIGLDAMVDEHGKPNAKALALALRRAGEVLVDILTMTPTSKPRARKINGGTKKRTPKPTAPLTEAATKQ